MGKAKRPRVITTEELENKGTRELLAYLKSLHRCEESYEKSDMEVNPDLQDKEHIYFKKSMKWETAYRSVKAILATREHIN